MAGKGGGLLDSLRLHLGRHEHTVGQLLIAGHDGLNARQ